MTANPGLPSDSDKGQVQAAPVAIYVGARQEQKQILSILLSSGKNKATNELRKNAGLEGCAKKPSDRDRGVGISVSCRAKFSLSGAEDAMGKSGERDFGDNSPAVVDGSFPVLGSGVELNPMDTVISSKTALVRGRKVWSLPPLGLTLSSPGSEQILPGSRRG